MERQIITVDIAPGRLQPAQLTMSQGDIGRPLGVKIVQDGADLDCSAYTTELYVLKPDGNYFMMTVTVDSEVSNLIVWETAEQETPLPGACTAQIRITDGAVDIGTARFTECIDVSPENLHAASETAIETLDRYVDQAKESADDAAASAASASDSADSAAESADHAEQAASVAGYMLFEIVDQHLIYSRTTTVDVDFVLDNGHLYVEVA